MSLQILKLSKIAVLIGCAAFCFSCKSGSSDHQRTAQPYVDTNIYIVDISCDSKSDSYLFSPMSLSKTALIEKIKEKPYLSEIGDEKYGVFLNGKYVAEKQYNSTCKLQNVKIDTVVDYNKNQTPQQTYWCEKDIPDEFRDFAERERAGAAKPLCIRQNNGSVSVFHKAKRIAFFDYYKYENVINKISINKEVFEFCRFSTAECAHGAVRDVIKKGIYFKTIERSTGTH